MDDEHVTRRDFEDAMRFVADAAMKVSRDRGRLEALARSLVRALVENRTLDLPAFERHLAGATVQPVREENRLRLAVAPSIDKHAVASPGIDCASLLHLCKARCCMLSFALTPEEVEDGQLAWSYAQPYEIAHGADHRCVHQDRSTGGCTVYGERPGVCRAYDCRKDPRVWEDFENRVPAPLERVLRR